MADAKEPVTVELPPEPVAPVKPTTKELEEGGLDPKEVTKAKKMGMTADEKPVEKKEETPPAPDVPADEAAKKAAADKVVADKAAADRAAAVARGEELPEGFDNYTANEKGLYYAQKKARARAQKAEAAAEQLALQLRLAQGELEKLKKAPPAAPAKVKDPLDELLEDPPAADAPTGKDKPLTEKDLERIEAERTEKAHREAEERSARAKVLNASLDVFHQEATEKYQDFETVTDLADEILKKGASVVGEDPDKQEIVVLRARRAVWALANAAEWEKLQTQYPELKGKTPADLVYELGRLHPKYKAASAATPEKTDGADDPEKAKKMLENAGRRSSASLGGGAGGKRVVEDDITPEQAARLTSAQYSKLSRATRERLKRMA